MPRGYPGTGKAKVVPAVSPVAAKATGLSTKEVCDIIGACKSANISALSFSGLSLSFHPTHLESRVEPTSATQPLAIQPEAEGEESSAKLLEKAQREISRLQGELDYDRELELEVSESDMEQLKVLDPVAWQKLALLQSGATN